MKDTRKGLPRPLEGRRARSIVEAYEVLNGYASLDNLTEHKKIWQKLYPT